MNQEPHLAKWEVYIFHNPNLTNQINVPTTLTLSAIVVVLLLCCDNSARE